MDKSDIFDLVKSYFGGDVDKTWEWFSTSHSYFGKTPLEMLKRGQKKKLIYYIKKFMT